jgi:hypothetical protein
MHDIGTGGGPLDRWLAIIGVISLLYWAYRFGMALLARSQAKSAKPAAEPVPIVSAVAGLGKQVAEQPPGEDIVAIAAAVHATLGSNYRVVHLEAVPDGATWAIEGRWAQQTSHQPRG